ncbi:MAG: tyrosine-type recombinase/integrase [Planctomycetes bacterium]|nr:tyrosine-type recombinase/integrase [Planctomycetota bacterium]
MRGDPRGEAGGVTFHALRHTAASLMVATGVPILDVARVLGHSTLAVAMRYAHFAPESGRAAIARLAGVLSRGPGLRAQRVC